MGDPVLEKALSNFLHPGAKPAEQTAAGELYPGAGSGCFDELVVVTLNIAETLRVGNDGNIVGQQGSVDEVRHSRLGYMVWWLEQKVATAMQAWQGAVSQSLNQLRHNLDIRPISDLQGNTRFLQLVPEALHRLAYALMRIFKQTGVDMRGTGSHGDAVSHCQLRHTQGCVEIPGAVVDSGKHVAVEVDHGFQGYNAISISQYPKCRRRSKLCYGTAWHTTSTHSHKATGNCLKFEYLEHLPHGRAGLEELGPLCGHSFRVGGSIDLLDADDPFEKIILRGGRQAESTTVKYLRKWQAPQEMMASDYPIN